MISYISAVLYKIVIDNFILTEKSINNLSDLINILISNLPVLIFSLVFLYIIKFIFNFFKGYFSSKLSARINLRFSSLFFKHIIKLPSVFFQRNETGELISRFQSILNLQQMLMSSLLTISIESISSFIGIIILFSINFKLSIIVVCITITYSFIFFALIPVLRQANKKFYSKYSEALTFFNQTISGVETIKINGGSKWFEKKFYNIINSATQLQCKLSITGSLMTSLSELIESIGIILVIYIGSLLVVDGDISLGTLLMFQTLMNFFFNPIKSLIFLQDELQNLLIIINRLNDVYKYPEEEKILICSNDYKLSNFDISLTNASYSDGFKPPIIYDINLCIREGDKVGIVGPSGSGKTTLLKLLSTIFEPTKGIYILGNEDIQTYSLAKIREHIAYVDQEVFIFSGTMKENLLIDKFHYGNKDEINKICEICGIYDISLDSDNILEMPLLENGNNLSGGQKQKIGIARALLKKPKILFLDEATSNLDTISERKIYSYLFNECKDMTIINISHNKIITDYMDYFIVMKEGSIDTINNIEYLNNKNKLFNTIFPKKL